MQWNSVLSQLRRSPRSSCFSNQGPASWKLRELFRPWKDNNIICNPLVLKSSYFKCEKNQENCEVWWLWTLTLQRYKGNEPFATDQPRDAKPPYWWANDALGHGKQSHQIWIFFPCLNSSQCVICSPVRRFLYLVIAHLQRAHCSTWNRPEKLWDFWETCPITLKSVVKGVSGMASGFLAFLLKSSE